MSNSVTGIYLELFLVLYREIANEFGIADTKKLLDIEDIRRGVFNEGLAYLTVHLPSQGKRFDAYLSGHLPLPDVTLFRGLMDLIGAPSTLATDNDVIVAPGSDLPREKGGTTVFLHEIKHASEKNDYCFASHKARVIRSLRQLYFFFYKLEVPYSEATVERVLTEFEQVDDSLPQVTEGEPKMRRILLLARRIVTQVLGAYDGRDIIPSHGPGSVSTGEREWEKSEFKRFYPQLDSFYSYSDYFFAGRLHLVDDLKKLLDMKQEDTPTAKIVLVPKDSRGPRIISMEPLEIQWIQQGLSRGLTSRIERSHHSKGFVNFTDQTVNRSLALIASMDNTMGTFDMKEASDRVSLSLVEYLFCSTRILDALLACRSPLTVLPNGKTIRMKKFAPMGSAVCFPVEALVFFALATAAITVKHEPTDAKWRRHRVFVYGDDLIFRSEDYGAVEEAFEHVGLKFNKSKCCYEATYFRESCGMDAFNGYSVTPLRCKALWSKQPQNLFRYVSLANNMLERGYIQTAEHLMDMIHKALGYRLPFLGENSPGIGWRHYPGCNRLLNKQAGFLMRMHKSMQFVEIRAPVLVPILSRKVKDSWSEVLRSMTKPARVADGRYALRRRTKVNMRWVRLS